jgi:hypothetical protein
MDFGGGAGMYDPALFRDRERPAQIAIAGVVPAIVGAVAGVLIGVSSGVYWAYSAAIALATIVGGFEHEDGWDAADRGLIAGAIYGVALLLVHAIAGTHAKVSLGSFPPLLIVITAVAGMLLSAIGGRTARVLRARRDAPAPEDGVADPE